MDVLGGAEPLHQWLQFVLLLLEVQLHTIAKTHKHKTRSTSNTHTHADAYCILL